MSEIQLPKKMEAAIQVFTREDESVPFWDNPSFTASLLLPNNHKPLTRYEQALEARLRNQLSDEEIRLLFVIGDAICVNEAQLRTYMQPLQSASRTSSMLNRLRYNGYVQRYSCSLRFQDDEDEEIKPPGVFVLGLVGYKLVQYLNKNSDSLVHPDKWGDNSFAIQRYVAMNSIRVAGTRDKLLSAWKWHPHIGNSIKFKKPFAVMASRKINDEFPAHFIIERVQMSQTFLEYLKDRLYQYQYLKEQYGFIRVDGLKKSSMEVVVISVSTVSLAEFINHNLEIYQFPYDILFMVDEWLEETEELATAFGQGNEDGISRVKIPFLAAK